GGEAHIGGRRGAVAVLICHDGSRREAPHATASVHYPSRRGGGGVAAGGEGAAAAGGGRIYRQRFARGERKSRGCIPQRPERNGLRRRPERDDRISLGAQ